MDLSLIEVKDPVRDQVDIRRRDHLKLPRMIHETSQTRRNGLVQEHSSAASLTIAPKNIFNRGVGSTFVPRRAPRKLGARIVPHRTNRSSNGLMALRAPLQIAHARRQICTIRLPLTVVHLVRKVVPGQPEEGRLKPVQEQKAPEGLVNRREVLEPRGRTEDPTEVKIRLEIKGP
jgi:hypothetical protein